MKHGFDKSNSHLTIRDRSLIIGGEKLVQIKYTMHAHFFLTLHQSDARFCPTPPPPQRFYGSYLIILV